MHHWGGRECICAVELLIGTGSAIETQHSFRHEMNQHEAPSPNAVHWWVRQWREEGSVACNQSPGGPCSVHTPENTACVLASVGHSPRWSTSKHAQALRMSGRNVRHILHTDPNLHPYNLQILHSLGDRDKQVSLLFGQHFQAILTENPDLLNNLLMSDKTHLRGPVNKLNYWHWSATNPNEFH